MSGRGCADGGVGGFSLHTDFGSPAGALRPAARRRRRRSKRKGKGWGEPYRNKPYRNKPENVAAARSAPQGGVCVPPPLTAFPKTLLCCGGLGSPGRGGASPPASPFSFLSEFL